MTTDAQTNNTIPHITVDGTAYAVESLNERLRLLTADLLRTAQEYQDLLSSYRQSLTLTGAYSGGLKSEVEKADLPVVFSAVGDSDRPIIKIDEVSYDATDLPDSAKAYVAELMRANQQKTSLEFRLRQLDAARGAYVKAMQAELAESKPEPMDPQPEAPAVS